MNLACVMRVLTGLIWGWANIRHNGKTLAERFVFSFCINWASGEYFFQTLKTKIPPATNQNAMVQFRGLYRDQQVKYPLYGDSLGLWRTFLFFFSEFVLFNHKDAFDLWVEYNIIWTWQVLWEFCRSKIWGWANIRNNCKTLAEIFFFLFV